MRNLRRSSNPQTTPSHRRLWWLCALLFGLCLAPAHAAGELRLIVPDGVTTGSLDRKTLRAIYTLRKRTWPDGSPIVLVVLPDDHAAHQRFSKEQLRLYPYQLRQRWDRAVFSGTGLAPQEVENEAAMLEKIRSTPGALGYTEVSTIPPGIHAVEESAP